jgi:PAS domain S-box-containing protein
MQHSHSLVHLDRRFSPPQRREKQIARMAGNIAIALGVLALIGWRLDIAVFKSAIPGLVAMKVNTAICFILTGMSLRLQTFKVQSPLESRIANGCAIGAILIALLTICQYLFGWNLGIDELLFRDVDSLGIADPGRMGINTALSFCFINAALLLINCPERQAVRPPPYQVQIDGVAIAQILTVVAGLMALQAAVSYAYNVRSSTMVTSMALPTTIAFESLCVGILLLRSDRGFMRSISTDLMGGEIARRFIPAAILAPAIVGLVVLWGLQANLYDANFALSLMAISLTAVWWGQIRINAGILNRIDYDRRQAAERIQSSEERLKLALQGANQGIWDFDLQTQVLVWDDLCKEMFGLSPDAVVTFGGYLNAIHPDDRDRIANATKIAIRDCDEFAQEYRIIHPDGTIYWVLTKGRCLCDPAGTPCRMSGTMMDITPRKQAQLNEQFLNSLTRRLRQLVDADEMQLTAAQSLGEYLDVERVTWFAVDWAQRLAKIDREWRRDGLDSHVGVYAIGDFLTPELQVSLFAGESVVVADVWAEPSLLPFLDPYRQLGMRSFANIPCIFEEQWVATLNVNTSSARIWRDDEVALMQAFVAQIWSLVEQTRSVQALRVEEERTRAVQAIVQQQLGEIEAIYSSAPVGLCFIDTDLKFVRLNEHLAQINGLPVSAHIGRTIREVLPESADTLEPLYRQVIESGEPILDLELSGTNRARPGVLRHWLVCYYPQQDARDRVVGVNVMVQEITERVAAEQERDRFFNLSIDLLAIGNFEGYFVRINPAFEQILGFTNAELMAQPWINFVHPDDREHTLAAAISLATGDRVINFENRYLCRDGSYRWVSWSAMPYLQSNVWYAIGHDITDQKRSQAALQEGEERFRTLADNMSQLAWMADASGGIFWFNRRWFDYTGTTLAQMQGWGWQQVHHPEHLDRAVAHFRHHLAIGQEWEDTFPLRGRDGNYRWFLSRAIPIVDETGQVLRWFGTNTDITEQQTALSERQQAQADLQQRNQELDSFVHVVAHDLKAPLRGITNLSQWIEDDLDSVPAAEIHKHTTLLRSRVRRMAATIDGLLDYARAGKIQQPSEPVVVPQLLAEIIDSLAPPPRFKIVIDPNLPTLNTKRLFLSQVFTNLISNAVKHHDSPRETLRERVDGTIEISGRDCGDVYEFAVADDGPGIPLEYHDRIFVIFQAVNPQHQDSSGIGLSIVKKIIEAEGGSIRLESQPAGGTTFYFTWPKS